MDRFLTGLAALSLGGSVAIVLMAGIRYFTVSRYAARWRCWIWLVLCVRLLIPFSLWDSMQFAPISIPIPENTVVLAPEPSEKRPENHFPVLQETKPVVQKENQIIISAPVPAIRLYDVLGILWIFGAAAVLLWAAVSHFRFCRFLRRWGQPVQDSLLMNQYRTLAAKMGLVHSPPLVTCAGLQAPMLAGIFRHVILLPETPLDPQSLRHTLLHELNHYRRKDIWLKTISLAVCIIHWFNPVIWYMNHIVAQDTELACDETLLRFLSRDEYGDYCRTILNSVHKIRQKKGAQK